MYIIITGNPVDGFEFTGPFPDHDDAVEYAEKNEQGADWWVVFLNKP